MRRAEECSSQTSVLEEKTWSDREEKQGPQGRRNKLNSGEKIEEMSPVNKILRESIFRCLLAVKSGETSEDEEVYGMYEKGEKKAGRRVRKENKRELPEVSVAVLKIIVLL
jgi:hypothetical protein